LPRMPLYAEGPVTHKLDANKSNLQKKTKQKKNNCSSERTEKSCKRVVHFNPSDSTIADPTMVPDSTFLNYITSEKVGLNCDRSKDPSELYAVFYTKYVLSPIEQVVCDQLPR